MDKWTYRGRGPEIPATVEVLIGQVYKTKLKDDPGVTAKEVMAEVHHLLQKDGKQLRPGWPGLSAIQKVITKIKKRTREGPENPLDSPWSVGCLAKYDIPPEALPKVMFIYEKRLREAEQHFTIREALWIARLHKTIDDPIFLEHFASAYALREWIDWILDNPVYTRDFDFGLINYNKKDRRAKFTKYPWLISSLPTWGKEEEEELEKNLRKKGYTLGIELTEEGGKSK